jgi:hypothetical protein
MATATVSTHDPTPLHISRFLVWWGLLNTLLVPLAFISALIVAYLSGFIGDGGSVPHADTLQTRIWAAAGSAVFGVTAGALVGLVQWLAIRRLKRVRHWVLLTTAGLGFGAALVDLTGLGRRGPMNWLLDIAFHWLLPAILVAILQSVALFRAGYRAYLWPLLGSTPVLFAATGYNIDFISAFPGALLGAILSAAALWSAIRSSTPQPSAT